MLKNVLLINIIILLFITNIFESGDFSLEQVQTKDMYILVIPKIHLIQEFFPYDKEKNTVDYGIQTIFPNKSETFYQVMLASHSGNASISKFKNLEQLNIDDYVYIYQNGVKNIYQVIEKHYKEKDGVLNYFRKDDYIILITCSKVSKNKQVYYVAKNTSNL